MTRWEYRYIDLHRGIMYTGKELSEFAAEARKAGDEGWEAVGQVNLTGGNTNVPVLMLKRRAD